VVVEEIEEKKNRRDFRRKNPKNAAGAGVLLVGV
jgi:hypothetical protein